MYITYWHVYVHVHKHTQVLNIKCHISLVFFTLIFSILSTLTFLFTMKAVCKNSKRRLKCILQYKVFGILQAKDKPKTNLRKKTDFYKEKNSRHLEENNNYFLSITYHCKHTPSNACDVVHSPHIIDKLSYVSTYQIWKWSEEQIEESVWFCYILLWLSQTHLQSASIDSISQRYRVQLKLSPLPPVKK